MKAEPTAASYVVNLLYRLEGEHTRDEVAAKLAPQLGLGVEVARKLVSREPGRLIKPTTLERAEHVANAFIGVGVPVEVVHVTPEGAAALSASSSADMNSPAPIPATLTPAVPDPAPVTPLPPAPISPEAPVTPISAATPEPAPFSAPAREAVAEPPAPPTETQTATQPPARRRGSLAAKMLSITVLPLLLTGLGLIAYLQAELAIGAAETERRHNQEVVQLVTSQLGTASTAPLETMLKAQNSVAFVSFTGPRVGNVFAAADASNAAALQASLQQSEASNPSADTLSTEAAQYRLSRQDLYRDATGAILARATDEITPLPTGLQRAGSAVFGLNPQSLGTQLTAQLVDTVGFIMLAISLVTLISLVFIRQLINPIVALTRTADRLSLGKLDEPVTTSSNDELGDLAEALERMRLSLKSAIERLRRRR